MCGACGLCGEWAGDPLLLLDLLVLRVALIPLLSVLSLCSGDTVGVSMSVISIPGLGRMIGVGRKRWVLLSCSACTGGIFSVFVACDGLNAQLKRMLSRPPSTM